MTSFEFNYFTEGIPARLPNEDRLPPFLPSLLVYQTNNLPFLKLVERRNLGCSFKPRFGGAIYRHLLQFICHSFLYSHLLQ